MIDPNHYIAMCARKYAEAARQLASTEDGEHQKRLKALLAHLKESAILETELERRRRYLRLPEDLRRSVDRKGEITRVLGPPEAEALRCFYGVPGGGVLGTLSSAEMALLADLYEGWSCTAGLDCLAIIRCQGLADAMRSISGFLGPDHEPHDPPERSINRLIHDRAFGAAEKEGKDIPH